MVTSLFFVQSSTAQKNIGNYFSGETNVMVDSAGRGFVDLIDGTRIYGNKVDVGGNFRVIIIVDKVKYELDKVKGVQLGKVKGSMYSSEYLTNFNGTLCETIVLGTKISVYKGSTQVTVDNKMEIYNDYFYIKNGGKPKRLKSLEDAVEAIGDCKATKDISSFTFKDLRQELKENKQFLNEYFDKYNKECK